MIALTVPVAAKTINNEIDHIITHLNRIAAIVEGQQKIVISIDFDEKINEIKDNLDYIRPRYDLNKLKIID